MKVKITFVKLLYLFKKVERNEFLIDLTNFI